MREIDDFCGNLSIFASHFRLSPRDLERAFTLLSLAFPGIRKHVYVLAWFIVLKLKFPDIYSGVLHGDREANERAAALLRGILPAQPDFWLGLALEGLHTGHTKNFSEPLNNEATELLVDSGRWIGNPAGFVRWLARAIDLSVAD